MDKDIKESREYRLAKDWEMAVNNYSSHEEAKCIMEYLKEHGRNIPLK